MRVSTNMIYDQGVRALQTQSAALLYTGQQIATGRKILTPADDPVASARALDVTQSRSVNKQFTTNQGYAEDALKLVEGQLDGAGEVGGAHEFATSSSTSPWQAASSGHQQARSRPVRSAS